MSSRNYPSRWSSTTRASTVFASPFPVWGISKRRDLSSLILTRGHRDITPVSCWNVAAEWLWHKNRRCSLP
jgi:hypothetical protein